MAEPNRFARFLTESEGSAQTEPPAAENRFARFAAEEAAPTTRASLERPERRGYGFFGLPEEAFSPTAFARGAVGGTAGLVGGAMELAPGAVGRAGAAVSRFGQEQTEKAMQQQPASGFVGSLAPAAIPLGSVLQAPTRLGQALRGAGVGFGFGAATPTGEEEFEERIPKKALGAGLGVLLGGSLPLVFGRRPPAPPTTSQEAQRIGSEAIARGEQQAQEAIKQARSAAEPRFRAQRAEQREAERTLSEAARTLEMAPTGARVGELVLNSIEQNVGSLREARKTVADQMYAQADRAMAEKFAAGDLWQNSPSGRAFLEKLQSRISLRGGTTQASTAEERLIANELLPNLRGRALPDRPASQVITPSGQPARAAESGRVAPAEPNVLRETLRKLRDAANGLPEEGYQAIGQQRAGQLANELAESLSLWEGALSRADKAYRDMSEALLPLLTRRGQAAMRPERFDVSEIAGDPAKLPALFFQSPQGVAQLKALTGNNTQAVDRLASLYTASQLRGKTPEQARRWIESNRDWLNPAVLPQPFSIAQNMVQTLERASQTAQASQRSARGTVERFTGAAREQRATQEETRKTIQSAMDTLDVADPTKLPQAWGRVRAELESTNLIPAAQLDQLGREIQRAATAASRAERRAYINDKLMKLTLPAGIYGAYQAYQRSGDSR